MWRRVSLPHQTFTFDRAFVDEDTSKIPDVSIVEASAELLYGLCHQRFILTRAGLQAMVSGSVAHSCWHQDGDASPLYRLISMKRVSSGLVLAYTATVAMSYPVDAPICPESTRSSSFAPTVTTYIPRQVVGSKASMVGRSNGVRDIWLIVLRCRRILWDYLCPSLLPELQGARTGTILEACYSFIHISSFFCKLFLQPTAIRKSEPLWWTEACGG